MLLIELRPCQLHILLAVTCGMQVLERHEARTTKPCAMLFLMEVIVPSRLELIESMKE